VVFRKEMILGTSELERWNVRESRMRKECEKGESECRKGMSSERD
jgi:hypothetical protein